MTFDFLFQPVEHLDAWLEGLFAGAPLVVALLIALVLGLRHASDPDHLVAVTSLVAADGGDVRGAARLTWISIVRDSSFALLDAAVPMRGTPLGGAGAVTPRPA